MYFTQVEHGSFPVGSGSLQVRLSGLFDGLDEDRGDETRPGQSRGQYCASVASQMPFPHTGDGVREENPKKGLADDRDRTAGRDIVPRDDKRNADEREKAGIIVACDVTCLPQKDEQSCVTLSALTDGQNEE